MFTASSLKPDALCCSSREVGPGWWYNAPLPLACSCFRNTQNEHRCGREPYKHPQISSCCGMMVQNLLSQPQSTTFFFQATALLCAEPRTKQYPLAYWTDR